MDINPEKGPPKWMMKVDRWKAFDSINRKFLQVVLLAYGFPLWLVDRVMECITSAWFSISVNGELAGFFPSTRDLR